MDSSDILQMRLINTGLARPVFSTAADAVAHLGAVQAQVFSAARWALGLRVKASTDEETMQAYDRGDILRVHVMRPTWHFVVAEDIRWMTSLTGPRLKTVLRSADRRLGLDEHLYSKSNRAITAALRGQNYCSRAELKAALAAAGIVTDVQRLAHIISRAEFEGLICSGPMRGKELTYALVEDRAKASRQLDQRDALASLARRYFKSHGPAQLADFGWWSGLGMALAREAAEALADDLRPATVGGKTYWSAGRTGNGTAARTHPPDALLLSIYDEYILAYRDRSDLSDGRDVQRLLAAGTAFSGALVLQGRVAGTWKATRKGANVEVSLEPWRRLSASQVSALDEQITRYREFLGLAPR